MALAYSFLCAEGSPEVPAESDAGSPEMPAEWTPEVQAEETPAMLDEGSPEVPAESDAGSPEVPAEGSPEVPAEGSPEMPAEGSPEVPAEGTSEMPAEQPLPPPPLHSSCKNDEGHTSGSSSILLDTSC